MIGGDFEGNSATKKFVDAAAGPGTRPGEDMDAAEANKAMRRLLPEERRVRIHGPRAPSRRLVPHAIY